jgi:hypothetical protein
LAAGQVDQVIASAFQRMQDLTVQRKPINLGWSLQNMTSCAWRQLRCAIRLKENDNIFGWRYRRPGSTPSTRFDRRLIKLQLDPGRCAVDCCGVPTNIEWCWPRAYRGLGDRCRSTNPADEAGQKTLFQSL